MYARAVVAGEQGVAELAEVPGTIKPKWKWNMLLFIDDKIVVENDEINSAIRVGTRLGWVSF